MTADTAASSTTGGSRAAAHGAPGVGDDEVSPQASRVIWLLLGAAFVVILNETIMGIAISHLIDDLGITAVAAQWLTTAFMLTMAVVIPITGFLLQRFTTRQAFIGGMSLFSLGTLVCAVAPGFEVLLAGRIVQASGTAIMMPLLMTTLMTLVPPRRRGRMMGRVSVVISVAPAIGPSLSGLILGLLDWRWLFGLVLPIALIMLVVGITWVTNVGESRKAPIDVLSVILSAFGFGGLVYGLSQIGGAAAHGSADAEASSAGAATTMWVAIGIGVVALALFVWRQLVLQRTDSALLDLRVFRSVNFSVSIAQMVIISLVFFGTITVLPLFLQRAVGLDALTTGLLVLPGALAQGLLGPIVGRIYDARGTAVLVIPGSLIITSVLAFYSTLGVATPILVIGIAQVVLSVGLSLTFTPLFTASLGSLEPRMYSYGSAILSTAQQVAGAAGIAVMIAVMSGAGADAVAGGAPVDEAQAAGAHMAFLVGAIISLLAVVGSFFVRKPADTIGAEMPAAH